MTEVSQQTAEKKGFRTSSYVSLVSIKQSKINQKTKANYSCVNDGTCYLVFNSAAEKSLCKEDEKVS